ncbi:cytochrome c3 family protein [Geotalea toluenoxydans]|nr:cytochrome c3 family protein [Geotalea toluenoxydans]
MVLVDGRVGCLTCHDPLNRKAPHLVASNDRSNLCLTCHIK